jgi:hypothetical protein
MDESGQDSRLAYCACVPQERSMHPCRAAVARASEYATGARSDYNAATAAAGMTTLPPAYPPLAMSTTVALSGRPHLAAAVDNTTRLSSSSLASSTAAETAQLRALLGIGNKAFALNRRQLRSLLLEEQLLDIVSLERHTCTLPPRRMVRSTLENASAPRSRRTQSIELG